jgi:hypothetical protein
MLQQINLKLECNITLDSQSNVTDPIKRINEIIEKNTPFYLYAQKDDRDVIKFTKIKILL